MKHVRVALGWCALAVLAVPLAVIGLACWCATEAIAEDEGHQVVPQ